MVYPHLFERWYPPKIIDRMISFGSVAQMYFLYIPVNGQADFSLMVTPKRHDHLRGQVLSIRGTRPIEE